MAKKKPVAQNSEPERPKKVRGKPFTGADDPRRNNGGVPREARELREALRGDADEIHDALMTLIRSGNPTVTIYAHRQLVGEPPQSLQVSGPGGGPITTTFDLTRLPDAKMKQLDAILEEAAANSTAIPR